MNKYSPYYDHDEQRPRMSIDKNGSWVHVSAVKALMEQVAAESAHAFGQHIVEQVNAHTRVRFDPAPIVARVLGGGE